MDKDLYGFPCAQDNFDSHICFQLVVDGWEMLQPDLTHHLWVKYGPASPIRILREGEVVSTQVCNRPQHVVGLLVKYVDYLR